MTTRLQYPLIAILFYGLGYASHAALSSTEERTMSPSAQTELSGSDSRAIAPSQAEVGTNQAADSSIASKDELIEQDDGQFIQIEREESSETALSSEVSGSDSSNMDEGFSEDIAPVKQELTLWAEEYKEELETIILANTPDHISQHMAKKVLENNPLLDEPELNQDPEEDNNWAYNKEIELKNYFNQEQNTSKFTLVDVRCKQLTCHIFGTELEGGAWMQVYVGMFQSIPGIAKPSEKNGTTNIMYGNGDGSNTVFHQIKFNS